MPIRPDLRSRFHSGPAWRATRERIRERAGNKCEQCGVPNGIGVLRACSWWTPATLPASVFKLGGTLYGCSLIELPWRTIGIKEPIRACFLRTACHWVWIVCAVAHLNRIPGDDRDENLMFFCQWCHLSYDSPHHGRRRATRKDGARNAGDASDKKPNADPS